MRNISACILLYGDYPGLAHRCLDSICRSLFAGRDHIRDFRLAFNEVSPATREIASYFVKAVLSHWIPVITYEAERNVLKYPMMRRMLLMDPVPPGKFAMWFDDDSYLLNDEATNGDSWWSRVDLAMQTADMIGKIYHMPAQGEQADWVAEQPWYDPKVGPPLAKNLRGTFWFCTGGWWTIRTEILRRWDWPPPQLRHRGGDALLGELLRQQSLRMQNFETGVRINADAAGRHSKSPRRGFDEAPLGKRLAASQDTSHQNFTVTRTAAGFGDARDGVTEL